MNASLNTTLIYVSYYNDTTASCTTNYDANTALTKTFSTWFTNYGTTILWAVFVFLLLFGVITIWIYQRQMKKIQDEVAHSDGGNKLSIERIQFEENWLGKHSVFQIIPKSIYCKIIKNSIAMALSLSQVVFCYKLLDNYSVCKSNTFNLKFATFG